MIWLSYGEVSEIPFWILRLMMSINNKLQLLRVLAKLVEASDCQHLPKIHTSTFSPDLESSLKDEKGWLGWLRHKIHP